MKRILVVGCLVVVLLAWPARAGVGEGNGEIGFDFGFTNFDSNVTDESGGRFTLRGGYHFTDLFQLEGELGGSAATEDNPFGDSDIVLSTLLVDAVFNFHPRESIVPYLLFGLGQANLEFDGGGGSIDDDGSAHQLAGGSRFFFGANRRVAVRVEISYLTEKTFDERSNHTSLTAGFTWRLGEGK